MRSHVFRFPNPHFPQVGPYQHTLDQNNLSRSKSSPAASAVGAML